ncbi:hypothetical protein GJ496_009628 [Pomphorhynchus laevis]|nr:hypothetical protein GJ496_009628 [Pomphorhynchus laevis]
MLVRENPLHSCSTDDFYAQCLIEYVQHPRLLREKRSKIINSIKIRQRNVAVFNQDRPSERSGWVSYKVANDNTSSIHYKTTDPIRVHADQLRYCVCQESELSEAYGIENAQTQCVRNDARNSCHSTSNVGPILVQSHNRRIHNDQPSVNNDSRNEETFEDERNTANLEESVRRSTRIRQKPQRYGFD